MGKNPVDDYDSVSLLARSKRTAKERAKSSVRSMGIFAEMRPDLYRMDNRKK